MACPCIRIYDFDLVQDTCDRIRYIDRSEWQEGGSSSPSYNISIVFPDGSTTTETVIVGLPSILDLGKCVPPGVYRFEVENCDYTYKKAVAVTCSLWCGWLRATAKIGKGVEVSLVRSIRERIEFIESAVSYEDVLTAQDLTKTVERDLKRINCDCSCL